VLSPGFFTKFDIIMLRAARIAVGSLTIASSGWRPGDRENWHPIVEQASKCIDL
jgi:hypothetical protein